MVALSEIDAIVVAEGPLASVRIAGLAARERSVRVAARVGARRVHVIEGPTDRAELRAWRDGRTCPLLVVRADQLVHTPLVQPLIDAIPRNGTAFAAVPEDPVVQDLTPGSYAGAFVAAGVDATTAVIDALVHGEGDAEILAASSKAIPVPHGEIARAPIATPGQRRAAHKLLYRILVKPQDNAVTRYLYRPVSFPLTRLLVWTPITPNQISYVVAALVALGCWITAHASANMALLGTAVVLVASYVDCCDGEVARIKLLTSRYGAWIDTVVDELSSIGYMIALGWHCDLAFGPQYFGDPAIDPWRFGIAVGTITFVWAIYCIYYNIIVAVGSANSQDYVGRFEVAAGESPNTVKLVPAAPKAIPVKRDLPPWLRWLATYAPYIVRRDFISWGALLFAALHWTHLAFLCLVLGGIGTSVIVTIDHVKLRSLRRSLVRQGLMLEAP